MQLQNWKRNKNFPYILAVILLPYQKSYRFEKSTATDNCTFPIQRSSRITCPRNIHNYIGEF
jgi:hypothetical protein